MATWTILSSNRILATYFSSSFNSPSYPPQHRLIPSLFPFFFVAFSFLSHKGVAVNHPNEGDKCAPTSFLNCPSDH
ncbi:cytochrome P450 [Corchorus capsularis]|uniref:Cytochrome P450 n=1 Tax=Corchorus capsularis TaxID=210143 RepID=A0A1R3J0H2_COCAP|nr:cytochrome P450 [Corchorus capsularis]